MGQQAQAQKRGLPAARRHRAPRADSKAELRRQRRAAKFAADAAAAAAAAEAHIRSSWWTDYLEQRRGDGEVPPAQAEAE